MRQLNLAIVFYLIFSITFPAYAIEHSQERLSIPEISLVELFKEALEALAFLKIDIAPLEKSTEAQEETDSADDPPQPPSDPGTDETEEGDEPEEPTDPAWGPYTEPNG